MSVLPRVLLLAGPTGVGKTRLSLDLADFLLSASSSTSPSSPWLGLEVISGDSVQVFKGLDIGADKVPIEIRRKIPHHLIDHVSFDYNYTAGDFFRDALRAIEDISKRNKLPVVVGGTGFYLRFLTQGRPNEARQDDQLAKHIAKDIADNDSSWEQSIQRLEAVDPEYAKKLHRNDYYRLVRGLVIVQLTGQPVSLFGFGKSSEPPKCDFRGICLGRDRVQLYRSLDLRCENLIQAGLVEEVIRLRKQGMTKEMQSGKAIGYHSTLEFLEKLEVIGRHDRARCDEAFVEYITNYQTTMRNFAKRQWQWFGKEPNFRWMDAGSPTIVQEVVRYVNLSEEERDHEFEELRRVSETEQWKAQKKAEDETLQYVMKRYSARIEAFQNPLDRERHLEVIWQHLCA